MRQVTETRSLKFHFTEDEKRANAMQMAKLVADRGELENQKKQVDADLKARIEAAGGEIIRYSRLVTNGYDYRQTECKWHMNFPHSGYKSLIRMDQMSLFHHEDSAIVEERRMEDWEMQQELKLDPEAKDEAQPELPMQATNGEPAAPTEAPGDAPFGEATAEETPAQA
jgi:hypothetical protein